MVRILSALLALGASALLAVPASAQDGSFSIGAPFSDGMVLQRGQAIPVWGTGRPGTEVTARLGDDTGTATVRPDGTWRLELPSREAADGLTLSVSKAGGQFEVADIAIGEVLLCSGQSNMAWKMSASALRPEDRRMPVDQRIRLLTVPEASAQVERARFGKDAKWKKASDGWADFSAVCLFTGREIARSERVPVGLIASAWGGTPIRAWLPYEGIARAGGMDEQLAVLDAFRRDPEAAQARYGATLNDLWESRPNPARTRKGKEGYANLFNGMIAPLGPTRVAGVIWYQGENEANNAETTVSYRGLLEALIAGWRGRLGAKVPFVVVQLAGFGKLAGKADNDDWAAVREAQRQVARDDPATELVVTTDVSERLDIHPTMKRPVGQRAGAALLKLAYGKPEAYRPPEAVSALRVGDGVEISISSAKGPLLAASWGRPGPFMLCEDAAGTSCSFADARFSSEGIVVAVPDGSRPVLVRYCWDAAPICNVFDQAEMPLGPFELTIDAPRQTN
ncbi:hypothetical protein A6F68_02519 [Tsuneonella dongtanensis]|uniref:Sialate O-acetylesterase domain-containing protein n=1 Tax=Tsuneonella dongtanensis TaxID=692370 RepID=A0A1B2AG62_9SPHN|nr:sialate O-acetylesterase [Tsuneonella dongtanensis]ANY21015.1 hypothetical protein A6F68_02519 [Tsuneonella dongtanensis]